MRTIKPAAADALPNRHLSGPGDRWASVLDAQSAEAGHGFLRSAALKCDPLLREAIGSMPEPLATMAGYHFGWWDPTGRSVAGVPGKSIRAGLVFASATACGDDAAGVPAAAAVELLHNFSLLHDDVIDGDLIRRGRETVWAVWGVTNAILLGDALHALAIRLLTELLGGTIAVCAIARLENACLELCQGQFEDCSFEHREKVSLDEYLKMAAGKTAGLMGCACALGALSAGAGEATVSAMERFGYELGLAFQIVDDLIGIWGDPRVTGKPVGSDLARRKATLPVVAALNSTSDAGTELAQLYKSDCEMTRSEVARATGLVEAAGGRHAALAYADKHFQAAMRALPDPAGSTELIAVAQLVINRDR